MGAARPSRYVPSPHRSRAGAQERQQAVYDLLAVEPARALTLDEIYQALGYAQTRTEVKSALTCLRVQGRVKMVVRGRVGTEPSRYRAVGAERKVG